MYHSMLHFCFFPISLAHGRRTCDVEATRAAIAKRKAEEAEKEAERAKEPVEAQVRNAPMIRIV